MMVTMTMTVMMLQVMAVELDKTSGSSTYTDDGRVTVLEGQDFRLAVIGRELSNHTFIMLVTARWETTFVIVIMLPSLVTMQAIE